MSMLYDLTSGTCLSKYVRFETEQEVSQIVSKSLDGTVYIQTVGEPQKNYNGSVFVTRAEKDLLWAAHATGDLIRIDVRHGTYYGHITSLKFGECLPCDYFEATVTLAKEVIE